MKLQISEASMLKNNIHISFANTTTTTEVGTSFPRIMVRGKTNLKNLLLGRGVLIELKGGNNEW